MINRELKINFKSLIIWIIVVISILLIVFLMYPTISSNSSEININDIVQIMPETLLSAFNIDLVDISSIDGFFKTEGMILLMLIYSIYSAQLGASILLKEESDKTIEYLYSKPISRKKILTSKIIAGLINVTIFIISISVFITIGLLVSDVSIKDVLLLNISLLIPSILLFLITLYVSTFFRKTKQMNAISYGIVFLSYFANMFSGMSENIEWLKYFSVYTLADIRNQVANNKFNDIHIMIFGIVFIIIILLVNINYNKKEYLN